MKDNSKADVSHTNEFDKMYQEIVKQAEVKAFAAKVLKIKEEILIPDNYEVWDDKGNVIRTSKIIIREKKKEYPKTFLGCCDVLGIEDLISRGVKGYKSELLDTFQKLLICRDAYWKIAGEEMGLNGPWKPDWTAKDNHFYTIHTFNGKVECSATAHRNAVLIFPTEEMRDAFYENFKELIEICKELL